MLNPFKLKSMFNDLAAALNNGLRLVVHMQDMVWHVELWSGSCLVEAAHGDDLIKLLTQLSETCKQG